MYVSIAGVAKLIAVILADKLLNPSLAVKPSKNTARHKRVKRATARPNEDGGCARVKKPWMIHLQHPMSTMLKST